MTQERKAQPAPTAAMEKAAQEEKLAQEAAAREVPAVPVEKPLTNDELRTEVKRLAGKVAELCNAVGVGLN